MQEQLKLNAADWITVGNLSFGALSLLFAIKQHYALAAGLIVLAALMDALDGWVASRYDRNPTFGTAFDAIADVVSFGVAPVVLIWASSSDFLLLAVSIVVFLCANLIRHVRIFSLDERVLGPTNTMIAILIAVAFLNHYPIPVWLWSAALIASSILLLSERPYFNHHSFRRQHMARFPVISIIALTATVTLVLTSSVVRDVAAVVLIGYLFSGQIRPLLFPNLYGDAGRTTD